MSRSSVRPNDATTVSESKNTHKVTSPLVLTCGVAWHLQEVSVLAGLFVPTDVAEQRRRADAAMCWESAVIALDVSAEANTYIVCNQCTYRTVGGCQAEELAETLQI